MLGECKTLIGLGLDCVPTVSTWLTVGRSDIQRIYEGMVTRIGE